MIDKESPVPIIRLWNVILVPIQGDILDHEAEALAESLLARIHDRGATGLIIDLSGVWMLDSHLCSVVVRLSRAARFLGTPTMVSGLSPEVALTLQSMGLDFAAGRTTRSLEEALEAFGVRPGATDGALDEDSLVRRLLQDSPNASANRPDAT